MTEQNEMPVLLDFFKALADENRLKIIGLLAQQPASVEALAEALKLSVSTVSHHLTRLSKSGLVSARAEGHYAIYALNIDKLHDLSQSLLRTETLPALSRDLPQPAADPFEHKVMKAFVDANGRITAFPAQDKKFLVLLRYVVRAFEPGRHYPEKEVNEILKRYHDDTASLRRGLVEFKLMERAGGGGDYWRLAE
ncbi:MAG: metalloregulator ArsR/SmtB family transcription factor [Anaerolineaceae bacterium]|nr:metalloregulator ArsR/SmtB family transcription factor [Anaerolineaceae bacterium]